MNKYANILLLFGSLLLSSCSLFEARHSGQIVKSPSDSREYQYLELNNGLKVLLVSDADAEFAAASMDVFVGSGSDPAERAGLAHFLEHMLFLGTEKYPDAAEYQSFIKKNGGSHNAYTSFEHTNYFFDVKPDALEPALDRFSQFFVAPSFDELYVEREKNAVDAEYKARIKDDLRRNFDVFKTQVNPAHNFRKFSVGNLVTLADNGGDKIRDDLLRFYHTWYKASNMALVVQGPQTLAQLQSMIESRFDDIAEGDVPSNIIDVPLFESGSLPRWVTIQPEKKVRELSLLFPIPDQSALYDSKPVSAVGHVLGHEGSGSLFSYLKSKNWAENLSAGSALNYQGGSTFAINIGLTEKGLQHQQDVIIAVFSAIRRLQQEGIPKYVVDDLTKISAVNFAYQEASPPLRYVTGLSNNLHYYPVKKVLSADYLLSNYRQDLIDDVIARLSLNNVLITVTADGFTNPLLSPFYQTPYAVGQLPQKLIAAIESVELNDAIVLPPKNNLLPDDFTLIQARSDDGKPKKVLAQSEYELWHKPLDKFLLPKAAMYYSFQNKRLNADIKSRLLTDFTVALLNDSLNEWLYPAQMAGLDYAFYSHDRGLTLKLSGFNDKQPRLLALLLERIKNTEFTDDQFQRLKAKWQRDLSNANKKPPYQLALAQWQVNMNKKRFSAQQRLSVLESIELSDIKDWQLGLWRNVYVKALSNGNVSEQQALKMLTMVKESLSVSGSESRPVIEILKLSKDALFSQVKSQYTDNGYLYYWQASENSLDTQGAWLMLAKVLESGYFDQLRTQQQLGYIVSAQYSPILTIPGLAFIVQSPKASLLDIHHATSTFLVSAFKKIQAMPEKEYTQYQQAIVQQLIEQPKQLGQESDAFWYEMAMNEGVFDRKQKLADVVSALSISDWQQKMKALSVEYPKRTYLLGTDKLKALKSAYPLQGFDRKKMKMESYRY